MYFLVGYLLYIYLLVLLNILLYCKYVYSKYHLKFIVRVPSHTNVLNTGNFILSLQFHLQSLPMSVILSLQAVHINHIYYQT